MINNMNDLVSLCKRRGFIFKASEIYGGINGFWDYGPLGVALKNNIRDVWWRDMVTCPPLDKDGRPLKIYGLDSSIIQNPTVWKASGHLDNFSDPMVDCRDTKIRYRADQLVVYLPKNSEGMAFAFFEDEDEAQKSKKIKKFAKKSLEEYSAVPLIDIPLSSYTNIMAPESEKVGTLTEPKAFNLMFETRVGAVVNDHSTAYLRPETAQGIFINYKNVLDSMSAKVPFGIAQIGKAFRNEVTPRNFIFRSREFEQMELEWFCSEEEAGYWYEFWIEKRYSWWDKLGLDMNRARLRRHDAQELAHYAKDGQGTTDIEYKFPFSGDGFSELEGIAHRCTFDLSMHQEFSGIKQEYMDQVNNKKFIPHVIEPSSGLTRALLAVLCNAYTVDKAHPSGMFLNLPFNLAPQKAAICPLQAKGEIESLAREIFVKLREDFLVSYEDKQSIGKRYARNDEIGTPYCITVDFDSLDNRDVTVRDRNTMKQERIPIDSLKEYVSRAARP